MTAPPTTPRIAHLDMDAFFASVELLRRPELRGLPVAIGGRGDPDSRAVVTTATYEARRFGIRSGIPMRQAARLCPQCVFLPTDFAAYRQQSQRFKDAIARVAPTIEDRGIDEVYIDLSHRPGEDVELARRIKQAVTDATGLTCSIAVAPNKLLAKIGSDLDKPDGLTLLDWDDVPIRIWPLPVGAIHGIGPRAQQRLHDIGIDTIEQLAAARPVLLQREFGARQAAWLHEAAHGRDERRLVTTRIHQSCGRETTLERDLHPLRERECIIEHVAALAQRVAQDLQRHALQARTVGIKLRFDDWRTLTRDWSSSRALRNECDIAAAAQLCLERVDMKRPVRLLGVRASALEGIENEDSPQLF